MSTDCVKDIIRLDWWSYHAEAGVSPHKRRDPHVHGLKVWRGGRGGVGTLLHIRQMQTRRLLTYCSAAEVKSMTRRQSSNAHMNTHMKTTTTTKNRKSAG